ncbi:MAG: preprotein translocase subunit SecY [Fimbriimonadaceae bacterium]|nr:preprotein translocase subunit SecY [Fimbriimonadaceae bacterium]
MSSLGGGVGSGVNPKALSMPLFETMRLAWADPDLRSRIMFVLQMFAVYVVGIHIGVPIPGIDTGSLVSALEKIPFFQLLDMFGGGSLKRVSIFALGLNPYITASIIMQILTTAYPAWKKELQEGGEYARKQQNRRTRMFTLVLCVAQGMGLLNIMKTQGGIPLSVMQQVTVVAFWMAGAMFILWLGEQISEKGIGNGVSLMIFAGIIASFPAMVTPIGLGLRDGLIPIYQVLIVVAIFLFVTWVIVFFTTAQRRIPIQHMRRQMGAKTMGGGGGPNYLPLSVNMVGVIPIIFAVSLIYIPQQIASMFPPGTAMHDALMTVAEYLYPGSPNPGKAVLGSIFYTFLIFFFTYFYTAVQYNVEDIANNLKRAGSFIPGVRPGKQTKDFLDGVISRITIVGAAFLALVALTQFLVPRVFTVQLSGGSVSVLFGTSLLIMVSVALETMRQIEANLVMKTYGQ